MWAEAEMEVVLPAGVLVSLMPPVAA